MTRRSWNLLKPGVGDAVGRAIRLAPVVVREVDGEASQITEEALAEHQALSRPDPVRDGHGAGKRRAFVCRCCVICAGIVPL